MPLPRPTPRCGSGPGVEETLRECVPGRAARPRSRRPGLGAQRHRRGRSLGRGYRTGWSRERGLRLRLAVRASVRDTARARYQSDRPRRRNPARPSSSTSSFQYSIVSCASLLSNSPSLPQRVDECAETLPLGRRRGVYRPCAAEKSVGSPLRYDDSVLPAGRTARRTGARRTGRVRPCARRRGWPMFRRSGPGRSGGRDGP